MGKGLTPKQAAFVREYLVDLNGTRAAIRAGYRANSADVSATRLMKKVRIRKAVAEAMQRRAERVEVKADDVLRELLRVATVDPLHAFTDEMRLRPLADIPEDIRRAIAGVEVDETFDYENGEKVWTGYTKKLKFWPKVQALELLGKHLKLFTEKIEHSADSSFAEMLKEARARAAQPE